ncbi:MAG: hypothetical protein WA609_11890 [Terriglobales bacterium]
MTDTPHGEEKITYDRPDQFLGGVALRSRAGLSMLHPVSDPATQHFVLASKLDAVGCSSLKKTSEMPVWLLTSGYSVPLLECAQGKEVP